MRFFSKTLGKEKPRRVLSLSPLLMRERIHYCIHVYMYIFFLYPSF